MTTVIKNKRSKTMFRFASGSIVLFSTIAQMGCGGGEPITDVYFHPGQGNYSAAQNVEIELPPEAENVYVTTDSVDPVADNRCAFSGGTILVDRPTLIKVRYDVAGKTYQEKSLYVVNQNLSETGFTNRRVLSAWERFFLRNVRRSSGNHIIEDGEGGTVNVETNISVNFAGIPKKGRQTYQFNFFERTDEETLETVMIKKGALYGYQDEDGGFYGTVQETGERIHFSGSYHGWADGDFELNAGGRPSFGYYEIFCSDFGCPDHSVTYAVQGHHYLEVNPMPHENSLTCRDNVDYSDLKDVIFEDELL